MSSMHPIDELFRNNFRDMEVPPAPGVWDNIAASLDQKPKRRIALWQKWALAASIALLISLPLTLHHLFTTHTPENTILTTESSKPSPDATPMASPSTDAAPVTTSRFSGGANHGHTNHRSESYTTDAPLAGGRPSSTKSLHPPHSTHTATSVTAATDLRVSEVIKPLQRRGTDTNDWGICTHIPKKHTAVPKDLLSPHSVPLSPFVPTVTLPKQDYDITISGGASPSFAYRTTQQSGTDNHGAAFSETGIQSLSGTLRVAIAKSQSRWSLESGIIYAQVGQNLSARVASLSRPMYAASNNGTPLHTPVRVTSSLGDIFTDQPQDVARSPIYSDMAELSDETNAPIYSREDAPALLLRNDDASNEIEASQILEYLEVPIMARYKLMNKPTQLSLALGVCSNFLIGNRADITYNQRTESGSTANIDKISYSARMGMGIAVPIFKSVLFNMEPSFNYFITPVNGQDFRPYSFAVFTGVAIKL